MTMVSDTAANLEVVILDTANLGDRSYVIGRGAQAVIVDPQRDIDRVTQIVAARGLTVTHVLETHFHNDYVSGGRELARVLGAEYVVPAGMPIAFPAHRVVDEDVLETGAGLIDVLLTPGHTPNHVSFAVRGDGRHDAIFTGGSMLFGSVGRPDLLGPEHTEALANAQWSSMRRIAAAIDPRADVYPTHGFGSFCSATATVGNASTVGEQIASNPAFGVDQSVFVTELIAGLDVFPRYYAHMGPANQAGAGPIDLSLPPAVRAEELGRRISAGEWVIDLRHRRAFAAAHLRGTLSFDLTGNAVTYLGWLIEWGTPITLLGDDEEQIRLMQRELVRIGIDRPAGYAVGAPASWATQPNDVVGYPRIDHSALAREVAENPDLPLLDVRRRSEFHDGHIRGASNIALQDLPARMGEVLALSRRESEALRVYCGSGFRASVACSLLTAAGVSAVHVDDDFANAARVGLPITRPGHARRLGDPTTG